MNDPRDKDVTGYLQSQLYRMQRETGSTPDPRPFVTISRQAGAGGITVGHLLRDRLRERGKKSCELWTVFDKDLIKKVAEEHRIPERFLPYMKEDKVDEMREILDEIFRLHPPDWVLVRKTSETILHLALAGHAILVGRAGNLVTASLHAGIHVRLIGSYGKRLAHIRSYYGFDQTEAIDFIKKADEGRRNYVRTYFGQDIDDPLLYDLVLNTDRLSYQEAAHVIAEAVTRQGSPIAAGI